MKQVEDQTELAQGAPVPAPARSSQEKYNQPFRILPFVNPRTKSQSWRVSGWKRDGTRVRDNFTDLKSAECRQLELTTEWVGRHRETAVRATKLTEAQVRLAETAFMRLGADEELTLAVEHWLNHGRQQAVRESPRLDDAVTDFLRWLETSTLRERTKQNLRDRINVFKNSVGNLRVCDITPEIIERYLDTRSVDPVSKDNDRRALSRFFSWCIERKRRWATMNPCREVHVEVGEKPPPAILSVDECEQLLRAAVTLKKGRLVPFTAVCLFAGLRPTEAQLLTWDSVNLTDHEIRLEGNQTKDGRPRVVNIEPPLRAWLSKYRRRSFYPANWRKDFDIIKGHIGYGPCAEKDAEGKRRTWPEDVLRHTAISHFFRKTGSYGKAAEQFGNSEAIIKKHYAGRVSSDDTRRFYGLSPAKCKRLRQSPRKA